MKGQQTANNLSARARSTATDVSDKTSELSQRGQHTAADLSAQAQDTASEISAGGQQIASNLSSQARGTANDVSNRASELSSQGQQKASDLSSQARTTASNASTAAANTTRNATQKGANAVNSTYDAASGYVSTPSSNHTNGYTNGHHFSSTEASYEAPDFSQHHDSERRQYPLSSLPPTYANGDIGIAETTHRTAVPVPAAQGAHASKQPDLVHRVQPVSYLPPQNGGVRTSAVIDTYAVDNTPHGMADRARGDGI